MIRQIEITVNIPAYLVYYCRMESLTVDDIGNLT